MSRIEVSGDVERYSVLVDGHEMADNLEGLEMKVVAGQRPKVTLHLMGVDRSFAFGDAEVVLSDRSAKALQAMGWTPPGEHKTWTYGCCGADLSVGHSDGCYAR